MLHALKFVQGAVAKKDFVPALTHFQISGGRIKGFNGQLAISSPVELDLDVYPKALPFIKAIEACTDTISLHVAKNGKLVVSSGSFTANIDCADPKDFPDVPLSGDFISLNDSLIPALAALEPYIATDASRPWACGVLFDETSAYATNNIIVVQYWLGFQFPGRVNIPASAVKELLRIGDNPKRMQVAPGRLTFHYEDGRWLSTSLYEHQWPPVGDLLDRFLNAPALPAPDGFWEALEQLLPFCDETQKVYFVGGEAIATGPQPELEGAHVRQAVPAAGIFNGKQLLSLQAIAKQIGFAAYPEPVPFFGPNTRGIIMGMRQ